MKEALHVLIVDEDRALCRDLSDVLVAEGHRVDCLPASDQAWRHIRELDPDVVLLDISLPEAKGLETLRRLHQVRSRRKIPVIVTSRQEELEYELLDAFDFLPKPLDRQRLLEDLSLLAAARRRGTADSPAILRAGERALFEEFLAVHSGLHFDQRNSKILERGLIRRMRAVHVDSFREYFAYLEKYQESRQELKKLLGLLTIGETCFFRYLPHYEALIRSVLPEFLERNRHTRSLRIWSAGCSSGEEPYSIAMMLKEHFPQLADWDVRILATDINKRALRKAHEGVFRPRALRMTESRYRDKYFRNLGGAYAIDSRIRDMVTFSYLNLQTGVFPSEFNGTAEIDILLCRNVMIYFRLPTVTRIVEKFAQCLRPGGYLFLGHAETLAYISDRFQRVHNAGGFYYRLRQAQTEQTASAREAAALPTLPAPAKVNVPPSSPPVAPRKITSVPARTEPSVDELYRQAVQACNREDFTDASGVYDEILQRCPQHAPALVGKGFIEANRGRYEKALEFAARALEVDDLSPEAYYLRGQVAEMAEDFREALAEYRKALLLDMNFIMPHYSLSKLYWRQGRFREARRELNNTRRLLENLAAEEIIPYSSGLSGAVFLELCHEDAARLEKD